MTIAEKIKPLLRDVKDFPREGVLFKDITPLLALPAVRDEVLDRMVAHFRREKPDAVAAIEARGFIFGTLIAQALHVPFIPVRKAGKLPYRKLTQQYDLEYGQAEIEIHSDAISRGMRVIIHDDLLATGGTAAAAGKLVQRLDGVVAGYSFVINLSFLPGEKKLIRDFGVQPHYLVQF